MKKPNPNETDLDDADIAKVFAAQSVQVPQELRDSILAQAQPKTKKSDNRKALFAVAAACVMAILITPVLLKEPESSFDIQSRQSEISSKALSAPASIMTEESDEMTDFSQLTTARTIGGGAGDEEQSPTYRQSPETWMNEIKIFITDGEQQKARDEYALFKQQHPTHAEQFKPDFTRRAVDD